MTACQRYDFLGALNMNKYERRSHNGDLQTDHNVDNLPWKAWVISSLQRNTGEDGNQQVWKQAVVRHYWQIEPKS